MTHLRKRLLEEIERRNYSQATAHTYVDALDTLPPKDSASS